MNSEVPVKIIFLRVADSAAKLRRLSGMAQHHFHKRERLLIFVPSQEAANYVDQLLWKQPEESFLPHTTSTTAVKDPIAITTTKKNINKSSIAVNLCSEGIADPHQYTIVYELYDTTHPDKEQASQRRLEVYRSLGLTPTFA